MNTSFGTFGTLELQHARRALEAEAIDWCMAGVNTQAMVGKIELLTAIGSELDARGALLPDVAYRDVCAEDGIRYSMQVRVF